MSLSPEDLKAEAQRFNEEVWNNRDLSIIEEFIAPEFKLHNTNPPIEGPGGYRQFVEAVMTAFPDIHLTLDDFLAEGDKTASRWTAQGTHQGSWAGVGATGKVIQARGLTLTLVNAEGKAVEQWLQGDDVYMLQQMGAIPTPTTAPA
jgi:steroid delta-isomerase-like uncharacterized protein